MKKLYNKIKDRYFSCLFFKKIISLMIAQKNAEIAAEKEQLKAGKMA